MSENVTWGVLEEIARERRRQMEVEGWTEAHDDRHGDNDLARAAACYALCDPETDRVRYSSITDFVWPWVKEWWKPTTYRRNLIKAGALIVAELERLERAARRG